MLGPGDTPMGMDRGQRQGHKSPAHQVTAQRRKAWILPGGRGGRLPVGGRQHSSRTVKGGQVQELLSLQLENPVKQGLTAPRQRE